MHDADHRREAAAVGDVEVGCWAAFKKLLGKIMGLLTPSYEYSKASTDKLAPSDCMGKPSANHLNGGQNGHCRGPYAFGDFWGGGWHRGMLYGVDGACKSVALGASDSGLAQCFDSFGDGCYCTPTPGTKNGKCAAGAGSYKFVSPPQMSCKSGGSWARPAGDVANSVAGVADWAGACAAMDVRSIQQ